ncbi:MAG TPA: ABC transporter permease [bacterium]|nr:ABC transporter permease [bacterium]
MIQHILAVARKEFLQLRRDRRTLPLILIAPVLQLLLFGYAATQDIRNVRLALVDQSQSPVSREIGRALSSSGTFRVFTVTDRAELQAAMLRGDATIGLVIRPDFERLLLQRSSAGLEVFADGSDPNTATVAAAYAERIVAGVITNLITARFPALISALSVDLVPRVLYNPNLASRNYMVPGVLAMVLLIMTTIMTSVAIVREYERGTIEQLVVTPLRPTELLAGKLIPYVIIGYADVLLVTTVATAWFRVPIHGSVLLLFVLAGPFLLATLGFGILSSTIARSQQQSMLISFLFMMPNTLLSGFMFPIESMPKPAQYFTYLIPGRYFLVIVRAIFLKGVGLEVLWPETLALLLLGSLILAVAVARYRSRRT